MFRRVILLQRVITRGRATRLWIKENQGERYFQLLIMLFLSNETNR